MKHAIAIIYSISAINHDFMLNQMMSPFFNSLYSVTDGTCEEWVIEEIINVTYSLLGLNLEHTHQKVLQFDRNHLIVIQRSRMWMKSKEIGRPWSDL